MTLARSYLRVTKLLAAVLLGLSVAGCQSGEPDARVAASTAAIQREVMDRAATGAEVEVIVRLRGNGALDGQGLPLARRRTLVKAVSDATEAALGSDRARVKRRYDHLPQLAMTVDARVLQRLAALPTVASVELNRRVVGMMQQGGPMIGATQVRDAGVTGAGQTVAIIDSGIDYDHPALGGGFGPGFKVVAGDDFVVPNDDDTDPMDDQGHGTAVAGIVASTDATHRGIAPGAKLVALKVLGESGDGSFDAVDAALDWVLENYQTHGITLVNMSIGTPEVFDSSAFCDLGSTAAAISLVEEEGIPVFVSAGNSGCSNGVSYPACASAAIAVGAVYDANLGPLGWVTENGCGGSDCGPDFPDCCIDVTTSAGQITCYSNSSSLLDFWAPSNDAHTTGLNGTFDSMFGGTSAASPYAAAAAALLLESAENGLTPAQLRSTFASTGSSKTDPRNGLSRPFINVLAAAQSLNGCFAKPDTEDCNDEDACTQDDHCAENSCAGTPKTCFDDNPCTDDGCNSDTGACVFTDNTDSCDDDDACTTGDVCAGGECGGTEITCPDDGDPCTEAVCDPETGCSQQEHTGECDDDDACTTNDTCQEGECSGTAVVCPEDDDACTVAVCDPGLGCGQESIAASCDDDNACTDDSCDPELGCVNEPNVDCDDENPCTTGSCNPTSGACEQEPVQDWTACGPDLACFSGTCETLPSGDGCADPIELSLGVAHQGDLSNHHDEKTIPSACDGAPSELAGVDAFHVIDLDPGSYDIVLTPTGETPPDLALALWDACDSGACLLAADAGDGVETIQGYDVDTAVSLVIQAKATGSAAEASYSLLVTKVPEGSGGSGGEGGASNPGAGGDDSGAGGDDAGDGGGDSGDTGSGGSAGNAGGSTGNTGGNASTGGNTSNAGGNTSTGGNTNDTGGSTSNTGGNGTAGTAGTSSTTGGGDSAGPITSAGAPKSAESSGCGCRTPRASSSSRSTGATIALMLALGLITRRRERRTRAA